MTIVTVAAIFTNGALIFGTLALWLRHRAQRNAAASGASQAELIERLAGEVRSLHATLDAVAIEVERLGEGQRYAARLLQERTAPASPPQLSAPPRVITPH